MPTSLDSALGLNYKPTLPRRLDWRVGCVGSGFIMRDCHLLAYRNAGFNPIAIASRNETTAKEVAAQYNIPIVQSIEALLANPEVEILDVAVPPAAQPDLIRRAVELGRGRLRGILAQKPLALSVMVARELVKLCADAGIVLAVNQNMRFDQSVRAAKDILNRGWLGEIVLATIDMRAIPHWMPWAEGLPSLSTFVMSIHHLDTFRYWLGTPERVLASTRPDPRTKFPHRDGINLYILEYESGARAASWDDVWTGPSKEGAAGDIGIKWRIEGTDGLMQGTIGWPKYPTREPSSLEYSTRQQPDTWVRPKWDDVWFPDAFVGTMAQLLVAVENGIEPEINGRDNVETVALCEAVFAAATEHRVVRMSDVLGSA
ncbi:oxidoreductase : Putative dehydrogenase OS=Singulisphaera acidiphila (strain ATCC BAA-1392 / DSM 18658 / VKM B-2454 / MOB10) GN=Sinac_1916 PE=4 SV=1: GFO_IDH_MocA [Gemmata massiliana]|uniref:Gfo/Idh/MocA-like oxidoreductase N-terminal domain-containing protein n=1 Tax=Gemmata massiliana TaxID=1210884 RepID=A0A6P2D4X0_9BACT|nr:Gfo/Idh/MocA family oxidoreductase [Gemmata massiliana]VTR95536.1 oxidoreductase : Putative dehydrogenase OS=Singulisphaera acidiphila (strain ATCC BAA-1392 / DSM 18658 / VKM B-2454 / MOB10) GN=Sinac_1916 PE=4 SV=1: GFO_IDH_MocA [Gemmata massiliana]